MAGLKHVGFTLLFLATGWLLTKARRESLRRQSLLYDENRFNEVNRELENRVELRTHELRESQDFLESLIQNIPNMIFVKDAQTLQFVRMNRAGEELLQLPESALIGKSDFDFFSKEEAEAFTEKDRSVLSRSEVVDIPEEPLTTPKGLRYLHTKKIPLFDRSGKAQYLLGISEDITAKKQAEVARLELIREQMARVEAEKSAQQLSFLTEASAALTRSLDLHATMDAFAQVIVKHMADWCLVHLLAEEKPILQNLTVAHHHSERVHEIELWWKGLGKGTPLTENVAQVLATGRSKVFSTETPEAFQSKLQNEDDLNLVRKMGARSSLTVAIRSSEKIIGALTLVYAETHLNYGVSDLVLAEELARRASSAIENARLYDRAQEASRAKSAFLANVSHEIRTPLGAMLGFADLMADETTLNDEQRSSVMTILRNGRHLLRIVDEILDLSKIESDYIQIERIPFSLLQVLEEISSLMRMRAEEKNLNFEVRVPEDLPKNIVSDPMRLRQILVNIIGNAIKFTTGGGVRLEIKAVPIASRPRHRVIEFWVRDTGIGLSPEQSEKLFQPFVQAEAAMNRRFGGTGLGLFLSRRLARLLGGDVILVESALGHGSCFKVSVEVIMTDEKAASAALENRQVPEVPHWGSASPRVLIVDDSPDNRLLVMQYMKNMGFRIDSAENGSQAVQMATDRPYDVILMDIQMPEVDGFQAVHQLRNQGYSGVVIALTAHAMKGDRERCLENGFDDYLQKPLDKTDLRKTLSRYLQEIHSESSTTAH